MEKKGQDTCGPGYTGREKTKRKMCFWTFSAYSSYFDVGCRVGGRSPSSLNSSSHILLLSVERHSESVEPCGGLE